jgi:hypothetical protein
LRQSESISRPKISEEHRKLIADFYLRDDISSMSPGIKQSTIVQDEHGLKQVRQKRFLLMTLKEAYLVFINEFGKIVSLSYFYESRPK